MSGPEEDNTCKHCGGPGARCEYHYCGKKAAWSIWMPSWKRGSGGLPGRFQFFCEPCRVYYRKALATPMKGIDRPEGADDDWKGSILDHIRHAQIAIAFEERKERERAGIRDDVIIPAWEIKMFGWTPAQAENANTHRRLMRKYGVQR